MAGDDVFGHGIELRVDRTVDDVVVIAADDGLVGRDGLNLKFVDLTELGVLGHGGTGHAGELVVQTEVVLQSDGCQGLVLLAHQHMLLGLQGLMQALGVTTTLHDAARELVDDLDLAVHDGVILVAMEHELSLEGLLQMIGKLAVGIGVQVVDA